MPRARTEELLVAVDLQAPCHRPTFDRERRTATHRREPRREPGLQRPPGAGPECVREDRRFGLLVRRAHVIRPRREARGHDRRHRVARARAHVRERRVGPEDLEAERVADGVHEAARQRDGVRVVRSCDDRDQPGRRRIADVDDLQARVGRHEGVRSEDLDVRGSGDVGQPHRRRVRGIADIDDPKTRSVIRDESVVPGDGDVACESRRVAGADGRRRARIADIDDLQSGVPGRDQRVAAGESDVPRLPRVARAHHRGCGPVADVDDLQTGPAGRYEGMGTGDDRVDSLVRQSHGALERRRRRITDVDESQEASRSGIARERGQTA